MRRLAFPRAGGRLAWPPPEWRAILGAQSSGCSRGRAARTRKGLDTVTTMSSAEPTRRDFLYIATGAVGAVGAAASLCR